MFKRTFIKYKSIIYYYSMRKNNSQKSFKHIYITDYQRQFILIGTTSVLTNTKNVGTNANHCISWFCIYVLYRLFSALLWNVRYQIQCIG